MAKPKIPPLKSISDVSTAVRWEIWIRLVDWWALVTSRAGEDPEDNTAYESGKLAYAADYRARNPHTRGTIYYRAWRRGFADARRRDMLW